MDARLISTVVYELTRSKEDRLLMGFEDERTLLYRRIDALEQTVIQRTKALRTLSANYDQLYECVSSSSSSSASKKRKADGPTMNISHSSSRSSSSSSSSSSSKIANKSISSSSSNIVSSRSGNNGGTDQNDSKGDTAAIASKETKLRTEEEGRDKGDSTLLNKPKIHDGARNKGVTATQSKVVPAFSNQYCSLSKQQPSKPPADPSSSTSSSSFVFPITRAEVTSTGWSTRSNVCANEFDAPSVTIPEQAARPKLETTFKDRFSSSSNSSSSSSSDNKGHHGPVNKNYKTITETSGGSSTNASASASASYSGGKYVESVRNREQRAALPGHVCQECEKFYAAMVEQGIVSEDSRAELLKECSRHKAKWSPPQTPEGFWGISLNTPQEWKQDED